MVAKLNIETLRAFFAFNLAEAEGRMALKRAYPTCDRPARNRG